MENPLISLLLLLPLIHPAFTFAQQPYDRTNCTISTSQLPPGATYICNSNTQTCQTYIVYRAQPAQTLSSISTLFNMAQSQLIYPESHLQPGREVLVPVICDCQDRSSRAVFSYNNTNSYPFSTIACQVYEGLVKAPVLMLQNAEDTGLVQVPVKCACANVSSEINATRFLVVYPVLENDTVRLIARKFGVSESVIRVANSLDQFATIFPHTTLIVPTKGIPVLDFNVVVSTPNLGAVIPVNQVVGGGTRSKLSPLYIAVIVVAIFLFLGIIWGVIFAIITSCHRRFRQPSSDKSSGLSRFSPDFLDGMSKLRHSLSSFSLDELRLATQDFSNESLVGKSVYKGRIGDSYLAIEEMISVESAQHVVFILTKINHFNVVKLEGCCYFVNKSYLVFEFAEHGSLRDCLADSKTRKQLTWAKRMQIAFDLAEGLHYIHYCTKPTYAHRNISSRSVLITGEWRAKVSGFNLARPVISNEGINSDSIDWTESMVVGKKGYLPPEYLDFGQASTKVDVYAFGVVLLELLSAKEVITDGKWLKDCVGFLADGEVEEDSSGCLEKFKMFMDIDLEGKFNIGDAMCLALLAKCCTQDDPQNRPTMNDVLKAFSRFF